MFSLDGYTTLGDSCSSHGEDLWLDDSSSSHSEDAFSDQVRPGPRLRAELGALFTAR